MKRLLVLSLALTLPASALAQPPGPFFGLDPASPSIAGNITPDDVLRAGPLVHIAGTTLGLQDNFAGGVFDNLNALSNGRDPIVPSLLFSVDRVSVGLPGSTVFALAQPIVADAARHVYTNQPMGSNTVAINGSQLGLQPGFFGDDLDGLDLDLQFPGPDNVYFSIDALSASNGFGTMDLANDIFKNNLTTVFAEGVLNIGLLVFDDIDGLVLLDRGVYGVLEPGIDLALFSLTPFSPSTFTFTGNPYMAGVQGRLSPADILFTNFTGTFSLFRSAADLGLAPGDNVDALEAFPEPASGVLAAIGAVGAGVALAWRRRRRAAACRPG